MGVKESGYRSKEFETGDDSAMWEKVAPYVKSEERILLEGNLETRVEC
ncbi:hypothetical protein HS1genome_1718 [Sulfodiicoccus acidiphilus]|uniref:Uncharacterized protein n=1 Tax=Sulfodiicoccus acidiphilus TaxID=1670455 RepID=A0A348B577_9CREN|nr:hypothetical protein HS1genome_1718 [Sulfodiicoccus acidiphilus]GGT89064.1 hypothetical protein GCM10007116_03610 [Sulfodiicoccus acidiphilus]